MACVWCGARAPRHRDGSRTHVRLQFGSRVYRDVVLGATAAADADVDLGVRGRSGATPAEVDAALTEGVAALRQLWPVAAVLVSSRDTCVWHVDVQLKEDARVRLGCEHVDVDLVYVAERSL